LLVVPFQLRDIPDAAIGRLQIEIAPARKMRSERTPAKIGRSMKNLERFIESFPRRRESS